MQFSILKAAIFRKFKAVKGLQLVAVQSEGQNRTEAYKLYTAQEVLQTNEKIAEKCNFRMKTN
ncbi:MAG: hypothetical protein A2161_01145 [Candidatus Schekmanbacteria bacterium RBG_13_48_7]|uniref:Uncharacterized protein n=1 Tax=Candidatus Schekmanbacteria bacterium RBG_13_48_7 TaxID=1817878 RepID=A0A1F7RZ89_9BACT|nr:MAG: hypothetical protein A2161_01145 [Candidatus Schekmanbacteria bacterium RBG_13_48_7]